MKKQSMILFLIVAMCGSAMAQSWDVGGAYQFYFPSDSLWKTQLEGGEMHVTYWNTTQAPQWGLALNLGKSDWKADSKVVRSSSLVTDSLEGNVDYTLCMLSALMRDKVDDLSWYCWTLEAGVGLMSGDADLRINRVTETGGTTDTELFSLNGDSDIWLGRVAVGLEIWPDSIDSLIKLYAKLGYQFGLNSVTLSGSDWISYDQDLDVSGAFVQLGAAIMLP